MNDEIIKELKKDRVSLDNPEDFKQKAWKVNAIEVFKDNNHGLIYGVEWDTGNEEIHNQWFKTRKEQEDFFKEVNE